MDDSSTTEDRVSGVFIRVLDLPPLTDWPTLEYRTEPKWDSVAHLQLILELEKEFRIAVDNEDVLGLTSFSNVLATVRRYVGESPE